MSYFYVGLAVLGMAVAVFAAFVSSEVEKSRKQKYCQLLGRLGVSPKKPIVCVDWNIEQDSCWDASQVWVVEASVTIHKRRTLTVEKDAIVIFRDMSVNDKPGTKAYFPQLICNCTSKEIDSNDASVSVDPGARLTSDSGDTIEQDQVISRISCTGHFDRVEEQYCLRCK